MKVQSINAATAKSWIDNGDALLIDVREPAEHASRTIPGAQLHPVGSICCGDLPQTDKKLLIYCQKGVRGQNACQALLRENEAIAVFNIEGGIEAWQQAGLPIERGDKRVLPLDRQVQLTIGFSVLTFSLLGYFLNPAYALGAGFFGAGLVNAGLTGWCGLGKLMAIMPWNK